MRKKMTEKERQNYVAMLGNIMAGVVYNVIFLWEFLSGNRNIISLIIGIVLALSLPISSIVFWNKDHENDMIKHIIAAGFAVLYTFTIITTSNSNTYVFALPMVIMVCVYSDLKYMMKINGGLLIENFLVGILGITKGLFGFQSVGNSVLQMVAVLMMGVAAYYVMAVLEINSKEKLNDMHQAKAKTDDLLSQVTDISQRLNEGIEAINEAAVALRDAADQTGEAMDEVADGASDTAEAVQHQLVQTEAIQEKIEKIMQETNEVFENMKQTMAVLQTGKEDVRVLAEKVEDSVTLGADITSKLETLDEYIEKMHSIVGLISGITSQTSLLALNASIEAARAGEAGKGFAVVAGEISGMATQTKDATVNITQLIDGVSEAINQVVDTVRTLIEGINEQKDSVENTVGSFKEIESNTEKVQDNVVSLTGSMEELEGSNKEIADDIQRISAISEELTARANETQEAEKNNMTHIEQISNMAQKLNQISNS